MPARTVSPLVATDRTALSPSRYQTSRYSSSTQRQRRQSQEGRRADVQDIHTHFDASSRQYSPVVHMNHNPSPQHDHAHSHSLPPPMQRTGYGHWHPAHSHSFHYTTSQHPAATPAGWLPLHPTTERVPPPPPVLHKVWILDCQSCGTFLTNRGMKAVLLLRPNVPLYSTDALPINCSAQPMTATSTSSSNRVQRPSDSTSPEPPQSADQMPPASRTCECLTQTLWCHGCGNSIGYMIVVPCIRCTSSMTVTNRTTNGHRFVFYSSEIAASERYYVSGELGVVTPAYLPHLPSSPPTSSPGLSPPHSTRRSSITLSPGQTPSTPPSRHGPQGSLLDSPTHRVNSAGDLFLDSPYSPSTLSDSSSTSSLPPLIPATPSYRARMRSSSSSGSVIPPPARLKTGDNLYWHHLTRSGEIPAVVDDPRARTPRSSPSEDGAVDDIDQTEPQSAIKAGAPRRKLIPMAGR